MSSFPSFQKFMSRLWEVFVFVGKLIIKKASSHWTCFGFFLVPVLFVITFMVFNSFLTTASSYWTCYAINLMSSFPSFQKFMSRLRNFCFRWKTNKKKGINSLDWLCIFLIPVLFVSTFIVFNSFLTAASSYSTCYAINLMSLFPSFQKFMSRLWEIFVFVGKLIIKKASSHWTCFAFF